LSQYDLSTNIYSPDGRVFQIEYAEKAVESAGAMIAVKCSDGVVIGVEKLVTSRLMLEGSSRRVHPVGKHAGIAFTGYNADGRAVVSAARSEIENYDDVYGVSMPPNVFAERMGLFYHAHTTYGGYRPLGIATILCAFDEVAQEPFIHLVEPSGIHFRFKGVAVGKSKQAAKTEIEKLNLERLTCAEALKQISKIIHTIREEEKDKPFELEAGWICKDTNWEFDLVPADIRKQAQAWGKAEYDRMDDDDEDDD